MRTVALPLTVPLTGSKIGPGAREKRYFGSSSGAGLTETLFGGLFRGDMFDSTGRSSRPLFVLPLHDHNQPHSGPTHTGTWTRWTRPASRPSRAAMLSAGPRPLRPSAHGSDPAPAPDGVHRVDACRLLKKHPLQSAVPPPPVLPSHPPSLVSCLWPLADAC
ncbi:hypothetical protein IQ07DRAFT_363323 [Pyrenochaeta sp. DS3sAY3a]|nr:hypothetical protein IQ07DRAFT_363323 [Pyrenochaeta sp. DS3sAY3a]